MTKLTALFLICLTLSPSLSLDPVPYTINTKKWSHVLDDHFISITVNPTDILQGKVYGLAMNSTMAILKGLAPAYVRIGSADTSKYTFKKSRYPNDMVKPEDEYTVTETHWMVFNEVTKSAGLDVVVCLNAAHKVEGSKKWDTRNSLELISFSDSQGYNLTWQLGYEIQTGGDISGFQFGKDLNRLRTILNAFPRYQHAKLIGPDIKVIHKKEDIDFWNDVLVEAGPTLDAVTWHPRWPLPSKMKVSDNSDLGYEFPPDYLEQDKAQLNKILQKSVFKNPIWIGEGKTESTGTFAEGLIWARRLVLAAKSGIEVVMKQPNLMDVSHPKPEYWIALLHKRLLGKSVLETRSSQNNTDLSVISHCTNPTYWSDKPEKIQEGAVTVYAVNMGSFEQKIQIKGTWSGKSQLLFQYVLTSGSDPDSVFSQMTYLNGEPLMMTDDGLLPDIVPRIKKMEKGLTMKLPPYSIGFWVVPEAKVKICQIHSQNIPTIHIETTTSALKSTPKNLQNIQDINQFIVEKLKNPESESEEIPEMKIEPASIENSDEKDLNLLSKENNLPRIARRIRQALPNDGYNPELKTIMEETEELLIRPDMVQSTKPKIKLTKATPTMEQRIHTIAAGISDAIKTTNQEYEFNKFLEDSGLKKDFGSLMIKDRMNNAPGMNKYQPIPNHNMMGVNPRLKRSIYSSEEESRESKESEEEIKIKKYTKKISLMNDEEDKTKKPDLLIPNLKGLEDRYKFIVHSKIQDGKRKIDGIKKNIKHGEKEILQKIIPQEPNNDIQEELLKKEIELLEKTEDTVADLLESQKKQQEKFKDILIDEINDAKGDKLSALREMYKNQRKNSIVKRNAQTPLNKPLLKTVEYIEKNLNLEPESVKKIKRSLEEKMGELLHNFDIRKSMEVKKRMTIPRDEKRMSYKRKAKPVEDEEVKRIEDEKPKIRKTSGPIKAHHMIRTAKKPEMKKSEEMKMYEDQDDSSELFDEKKFDETLKPERKRVSIESIKQARKDAKSIKQEEMSKPAKIEKIIKKKREEEKYESVEEENSEEVKEEIKEETEVAPEPVPIKNDKKRRENMLRQISSMVDHMNSMEEKGERLKRMDDIDNISDEFESDRIIRKFNRRPRKADLSEIIPQANLEKMVEKVEEKKEEKVEGKKVEKVEEKKVEKTDEPKSEKKETKTEEQKSEKKGEEKQEKMQEKNTEKIEEVNAKKVEKTEEKNMEKVESPKLEKVEEKKTEEKITEAPETSSTSKNRSGKLRKRIRPSRKFKNVKKSEGVKGEESNVAPSVQEKRHLDIPTLEFEKKKGLLKAKTKKIIPRHIVTEYQNFEDDKFPVFDGSKIIPLATEVIHKKAQDLTNEKAFGKKNIKDSKRNTKNVKQKKGEKINFSEETPAPTEGYIVVEPTTEDGVEKKIETEKGILLKAESLPKEMSDEDMDSLERDEPPEKKSGESESDERVRETIEEKILEEAVKDSLMKTAEVVGINENEPQIIKLEDIVNANEMTDTPGENQGLPLLSDTLLQPKVDDISDVVKPLQPVMMEAAKSVDSLIKETAGPLDSAMRGAANPVDSVLKEATSPLGSVVGEAANPLDSVIKEAASPLDSVMMDVPKSIDSVIGEVAKPLDTSMLAAAQPLESGIMEGAKLSDPVAMENLKPLDSVILEATKSSDPVSMEALKPIDTSIIEAVKPLESEITEEAKLIDPTIIESTNPSDSSIIEAIQPLESAVVEETKLSDPIIMEKSKPLDSVVMEASNPSEPIIAETPKPLESTLMEAVKSSDSEILEAAKPLEPEMAEVLQPSESLMTDTAQSPKIKSVENSQRKRRATFLTHRGDEEDDEDEDFSSEERIKKFKQMIYKNSPAKKNSKNEVRPSGGMGMGADEFIRMAGSTVRVMFDDVIPEAYGQTKSKIQNMGIPEYIKELGKIVQQMKNLDQIFLNIGEAAVKGYIKGNKAEKGPYIQVISRKKRSTSEEDTMTDIPTSPTEEYLSSEEVTEPEPTITEISPTSSEITTGSNRPEEYARPGTGQTFSRGDNRKPGSDRGELREIIPKSVVRKTTSGNGKKDEMEKTEIPQNVLTTAKNLSKTLQNQIPKITKEIKPFLDKTEAEIKKVIQTEEFKEQITPWIKTTKDFIKQAFTTLRRQKELSELLASDLLGKEEALKRAIEKREATKENAKLPVYQLARTGANRKRETQNKNAEGSLIRQLRGLQPGVYVVPTEEMTNIRSEQVTTEAKAKSGLPNVVTLNIYYDKKNQETAAKADATAQTEDPALTQDILSFYQNKGWNSVSGQYDQNNQYVSPVMVPDVNLQNPLMTPVQMTPGVQYPAPELPNSRLIQYPSSNLHQPIPAVPRYPPIVPNPQPVYNPSYYLPPDTRFIPQPPGTKRQWREFKARNGGVAVPIGAVNNEWNIQYETVPGSVKSTLKPLFGSSYGKNLKLFGNKKRSIGEINVDPSRSALPVWKFFPSSSEEKKELVLEEKSSEEKEVIESIEAEDSSFEVKKEKVEKKKEKGESAEEETGKDEEEKSRKRRSVSVNTQNELPEMKKIFKRSQPYHFQEHDIIPQWFGAYQEIDNGLEQLPTHIRRSHIISTSLSDEVDELLANLEADDELSLVDLVNDDYYYLNDNSIAQLKRYSRSRRSTDQSDSNMIKTNMIYKTDSDNMKPKMMGMAGVKKLTDEDSSLELVTKKKELEIQTTSPEVPQKPETQTQFPVLPEMTPHHIEILKESQIIENQQPYLMLQQQLQQAAQGQLPVNGTIMLPRNSNDDSLYYFFKYAYDSLVKVMKNMAQLF